MTPRDGDGGLVDLHLRQMQSRGLSPLTVAGRRNVLRRLATYLDAPAIGATTAQLDSYLDHRRACRGRAGRTVSPNTIRNDLAHLRAFYDWMRRHDYRSDDPTARLDTPRLVKPLVAAADDDAVADALDVADVDDRAIIALAAFAGLRAAEVAGLDWSDVDLRDGEVVVRGKGGKIRALSLSEPVTEALVALPHRHGPVIRRRDGRSGYNASWQISKRASRILGGRESGFTLHQLRHRFATSAYDGTRDLRAVQESLGHSSPTTTAIYAHTRAEAIKAAATAAATLRRRA